MTEVWENKTLFICLDPDAFDRTLILWEDKTLFICLDPDAFDRTLMI